MPLARLRLGIVLVTLTAVGALVGSGSAWWVSGALDVRGAPLASAIARAPSAPGVDPCALLDRPALFGRFPDIACGAIPPHDPDPDPADHDAMAACPTTLRLVGAVVPRRGEPFAAIVDATGASLLYTEGMHVGQSEVSAIGPERVVLTEGRARCLLTMFDAPEAAPTASAPDPAREIETVGAGTRRVSRSLVDRLVRSGELISSLRAIPHQSLDGSIDGYRIYGVRPGSTTAQLGIENGDVVTHVDDGAITDVAAAIDAFARVQTAGETSLRVVRRGQTETLRYEIR